MTTTCVPFRWAAFRWGMKCGAVVAGLWPQITTTRLWATCSYGGLCRAPSVISTAIWAASPQIARSSWLAPSRFQKRPLLTPICTSPSVPL